MIADNPEAREIQRHPLPDNLAGDRKIVQQLVGGGIELIRLGRNAITAYVNDWARHQDGVQHATRLADGTELIGNIVFPRTGHQTIRKLLDGCCVYAWSNHPTTETPFRSESPTWNGRPFPTCED